MSTLKKNDNKPYMSVYQKTDIDIEVNVLFILISINTKVAGIKKKLAQK